MIKTNIKMRVTPEQSAKVQEICFENGIDWKSKLKDKTLTCINEPFIFVKEDKHLTWLTKLEESDFMEAKEEEIDPDLFIRTNGSCIDECGTDNTIDINQKPIQYQIGIDTFQRAKANLTKDELIACIKFNIDKYNWRKKGQDIEDFKKIIDYANFAIEVLKGEK